MSIQNEVPGVPKCLKVLKCLSALCGQVSKVFECPSALQGLSECPSVLRVLCGCLYVCFACPNISSDVIATRD